MPDGPTRLLKPLMERRHERLRLWIVCGQTHKHANPSHALTLLRTRGHRPNGGKATEQTNEIAPPHSRPRGLMVSDRATTMEEAMAALGQKRTWRLARASA